MPGADFDIPTIVTAPPYLQSVMRSRPTSSVGARAAAGRGPGRPQSAVSSRPQSAASNRSTGGRSTGSVKPLHVWTHGMRAPARPNSAALRRPDTAGLDRADKVDPGRIRPRSAFARHSEMEDGVSDDVYSVASTKYRPSSPGLRSRPISPSGSEGFVMEDSSDDQGYDGGFGVPEGEDEDAEPSATIRRYFTKGIGPDGKPGVQSHFCVRIPHELPQDHSTNFLRVYYSDFLAAGPTEPPFGRDERTVEVEKMVEWLQAAEPRSRIDAYPLLLLTKDMLRRFVSKDIHIASGANMRLKEGLALAEGMNKKDRREIARLRAELAAAQQRVKEMEAVATELERVKAELVNSREESAVLSKQVGALQKAMEEQKISFTERMDEVRHAVKEKTEKALQARMDSLLKEMATARDKLAASEVEQRAQKHREGEADKQMKLLLGDLARAKEKVSLESVLKSLETWGEDQKMELLAALLNTPGSIEHCRMEFDRVKESDASPLEHAVRWMEDAGMMCSAGRFSRLEAPGGDPVVKMKMLTSLLVHNETREDGVDSSAASLIDIILEMAFTGTRVASLQQKAASLKSLSGEADRDEDDAEEVPDADLAAELSSAKISRARSNAGSGAGGDDGAELGELRTANGVLTDKVEELQGIIERMRLEGNSDPVPSGDSAVAKVSAVPPELEHKASKPKVLKTYIVDPRLLKGKNIKAMNEQAMLRLVADAYENKATADLVDDRQNNDRQNFPEYLRDYLINRFGLKSIAMSNMQALILGLRAINPKTDGGRRLRVFGLIAGIIEHPYWHQDLCNFLLCVLGDVFTVSQIKENMDHDAKKKPLIDTVIAMEATQQAWSKYGSGAYPSDLQDEIIRRAREGGGSLLLNEWLTLLVEEWLRASEKLDEALLAVFTQHDTNSDGVLDVHEFKAMVQSLVGEESIDDVAVGRLFTKALEESSSMNDGSDASDVMYPKAFCQVARMSGFMSKAMHAGAGGDSGTPGAGEEQPPIVAPKTPTDH